MRIYITLLAALTVLAPAAYGQAVYEPQILITAPNEVTYDEALKEQALTYDRQIKEAQAAGITSALTEDTSGQPANIKIMVASEMAFAGSLDFSKLLSYNALQYLSYYFYERFPDMTTTIKDIKCTGEKSELEKIATEQQLQYVLNFPKTRYYKDEGVSKASITVQFYDRNTNSILLNKVYSGDWHNPGGAFMCPDSSLLCTINNALSTALGDIVEIVFANSPTLQNEALTQGGQERDEEALYQLRYNELIDKYYPKAYDSVYISDVLSQADTFINTKALYHGLTNSDKTRFIAFLMEKDAQGRYGYMIKGAEYKNEWYIKQSEITRIGTKDPELGKQHYYNSLQRWGFFKEGTTDYNPEFWTTNLFEPVEDLRQAPQWEKYKDAWAARMQENIDYIGIPVFVAAELKQHRKAGHEQFDSLTGETVFMPFYDIQKITNPTDFADYSFWGKKPTLIFPKSRAYALNPIAVTDGKGQKMLHFYFAFAGSETVYEWTYFEPVPIKTYSGDIIDQLSKLTEWNFAYSTLDDEQFWAKYVLAKEGDAYKYLRLVE